VLFSVGVRVYELLIFLQQVGAIASSTLGTLSAMGDASLTRAIAAAMATGGGLPLLVEQVCIYRCVCVCVCVCACVYVCVWRRAVGRLLVEQV